MLKSQKKKKMFAFFIVIILLLVSIYFILGFVNQGDEFQEISIEDILEYKSNRNTIEDIVIVNDENPMYALIATPIACWYNIGGASGTDDGSGEDNGLYGLKPLLISSDSSLDLPQTRFISKSGFDNAILIGNTKINGVSNGFSASGSPAQVSIDVAKYVYSKPAGVLIIEDSQLGYELGVSATPIASYLNIPIIIIDSSTDYENLRSKLKSMETQYIITLGENSQKIGKKLKFKTVLLESSDDINENVLIVVKHRFNEINYITMTNPADVIPPEVISSDFETFSDNVNNIKVKTGISEIDIIGESRHTQDISVPEGINRIQININFTNVVSKPLDPLKDAVEIEPLIFASLYDPQDRIVAYAPSFSLEVGKTYLETQTFSLSGTYKLVIDVYYGTDGLNTYAGTQLGFSNIEGSYEIDLRISTLLKPHLPIYPELSLLAPYLTASHGGIVLADPDFELTTDDYAVAASGYGTGPWYEKELHKIVNQKVGYIVEKLNGTLESLKEFDLYDNYINGPAWLAILAGSNMIPQYYEPKEASWVEDSIYGVGWPTENKYSMNLQLSYARVVGRSVADVSTIIARSLFYKPYTIGHSEVIKQEYGNSEEWGNNFHFLAGEMGGRTGWFFWQRNFAPEVEDHGFSAEEYYQNYENDRQTMIQMGAYERANYFDLMMHGNWYWYVPELNGIDSYSTGVKVSDIIKAPDDWELGPSTYVTGSCILGRIDGISPKQSMTFAFMHAGVNAFFSASRSTGSEAKAGTIEQSLLYNDISIGEALRLDKHENQEPAAFYVRNVFGDPAFNPYEPENGFSDQGRPKLAVDKEGGNEVSEEDSKNPNIDQLTRGSGNTNLNDIDQSFLQYHTYDTMKKELNSISAEHPEIVAKYSIGTTYENREIWAIKISDNPNENEEGEPEILFTGAHHGKEWPSYEVPLYFLKFLVENYRKGSIDNDDDGLFNEDKFDGIDNDDDGAIDEDEDEARINWLIDNRQIWIVPMVNPDGVEFSHAQVDAGETNQDNLWRKNREPNINPVTGQPYPENLGGRNMWGTDINRNYGFHWGEIGYQGNIDPSREDYIGPKDTTDEDNDRKLNEDKMDNIDNDHDGKIDEDIRGGFSTAETLAIKKLVEEHNFVITMNFHTYGEKIYWPWMWTLELPPDEELFCHLAKNMAQFNGYEYRDMSERRQDELSRHPPVDGDSNDWLYGKHNILAYTIELGTQFIPSEDEIVPLCKLHLGSNLFITEAADNPWGTGIEILHEPIKNTTNTEGYKVRAIVNTSHALELKYQGVKVFYSTNGQTYKMLEMKQSSNSNEYIGTIPGQVAGTEINYYLSVIDMNDHITQQPKYAPYHTYSFSILPSKGEATPALLIIHVLFIVGAIIFVLASGFYSVKYLRTGKGFNKSVQMAGIATGMIFIGGFPLGFIIAYQVYGTPWTGIPFGWDITDNKTLVILLYWVISLFLIRGTIIDSFSKGRGRRCPFRWLIAITKKSSLTQDKERKDTISHNKFAKLAIIGTLFTISLYLIPHSIMVSPIFSIILFGLLVGIFFIPEYDFK